MAAPIAAFVQLPLDTSNTGKLVRTQTRVVGANTVHEHFFIPSSKRNTLGLYHYHSGLLTIPITAHTPATTAYMWLANPVGSAVKLALRKLKSTMQFTVTSAIDVSVPRQAVGLFTFTGAFSGAGITPAKRDSTDASAVGVCKTAVTGATVTNGNILLSELPPIMPTATSATIQGNSIASVGQAWSLCEDEQPVLRPGEGLVFYSPDASTTANRRLIWDMIIEEFE